MGWFSKNKEYLQMEVKPISWIELTSLKQFQDLLKEKEKVFVIFKHSTRCSISKMVLNRFQEEWNVMDKNIIPLFLDLLSHRDISSFIADLFDVKHESPQVIIIKKELVFHHASHTGISFLKAEKSLSELK